jgi:alpha-galactosidase
VPHGGAGDWLACNAKFPHGLAWLSDRIHRAGLDAGLWLAPFLTTAQAEFAQAHPEATFEPAEPAWWLSHPCRVVDGSHPAARQWLRTVSATLTYDMGWDFLKLDFLHVGADRRVAALRDGLESLRQGAGSAYLLGCGAPLLTSVGLVDGMRVGADVGPRYEAPYGVVEGVRAATARGATHGRLWVADLDCLLLRAPLSRAERQAHLSAIGLCGQVFLSDVVAQLDQHDVMDLRRVLPPHPHKIYTLPGTVFVWTGTALVVALFNRAAQATRRALPASPRRLSAMAGLDESAAAWHVFDYWRDTYLGCRSRVSVSVPGHGCAVLRLTPPADEPVLVGSDGHLVDPDGQGRVWMAGHDQPEGAGWHRAARQVWRRETI